tara:strand:+ start:3129 stop:4154 length:1026 start_codon:yes stop_codon:yes gene_type:complete
MNINTKFFLLTYLLSWTTFISGSWATIPKEKCINVDYSDRFGPVRDQDGHGYCWAFQASALAEEYLCRNNPTDCGKSMSPLDISRCDWSLVKNAEGGFGWEGLKCAIQNGGVCPEDMAPYSSLTSMGCSFWDFFFGGKEKCNHNKVADLYDKWESAKNKYTCDSSAGNFSSMSKSLKEIQTGLISSLRETIPEQLLSSKNARSIFSLSDSRSDFLRRVLISSSCEKNRFAINARVIEEHLPYDDRNEEQKNEIMNFIVGGLSSGSSVAVSMNLGKTGFLNSLLYGDGSHGIVVTGMRYNAKKGKCELRLRNSWGEGADFHGWHTESSLRNAIYKGYYLEDK